MKFKLNAEPKNQSYNASLLQYLQDHGFTVDRFGHAIKKLDPDTYRVKCCAHSVRIEVKAGSRWVRLRTVKYSGLHVFYNIPVLKLLEIDP